MFFLFSPMTLSAKSTIILESIHSLLPLADMIKEWQSSMIPSISTCPGKLENMWPIAYHVIETSYLRNPEKQWVFISRDTSTLAGPYPLSWRCYPTISSSAVPFSSHPQFFPASGSFQMSHLFTPGGQSIGVSASTSVPPMNTQNWFPLGWTGRISFQSKGLSRVFSNTTVQKHQFFWMWANVLCFNSACVSSRCCNKSPLI